MVEGEKQKKIPYPNRKLLRSGPQLLSRNKTVMFHRKGSGNKRVGETDGESSFISLHVPTFSEVGVGLEEKKGLKNGQ